MGEVLLIWKVSYAFWNKLDFILKTLGSHWRILTKWNEISCQQEGRWIINKAWCWLISCEIIEIIEIIDGIQVVQNEESVVAAE